MGKKGNKKGNQPPITSCTDVKDASSDPLLTKGRHRQEEDIPEDCACCGTLFRICAKISGYTCAVFVLVVVLLIGTGMVDMGFGDSPELTAWREGKLTKLYRKKKNSTYLRKRSLDVEVLSVDSPRVWLVPGFLSARECEFVREVYGPWLHTCDAGMYSRFRVSSGDFQKIPKPTCRKLETTFTPSKHGLLDAISKRIAKLAGKHCYRPDDCRVPCNCEDGPRMKFRFEEHLGWEGKETYETDGSVDADPDAVGPAVVTATIFLSGPDLAKMGGGIRFPNAAGDATVFAAPRAGDLLLYSSCGDDPYSFDDEDQLSLHEAVPTELGETWTLTSVLGEQSLPRGLACEDLQVPAELEVEYLF